MSGARSHRRVVVMFGGGGALGAFSCGVWKALSPLLAAQGSTLVGVGGTSIGAINAALLARHGQDFQASADALEAVWRQRIATPSLPFTGWFGHTRDQQSWNGVLTGMLWGSRGLYHSNLPNWNPFTGLNRLERPLMDRSRMWQLLEEHWGAWPGPSESLPMLGVGAVDVMSGQLTLFDSDQHDIGVAHLAASSALPLVFDPVTIEGRLYWDGDVTRQSALPLLLRRLAATGRLSRVPEPADHTLLITVDLMSEALTRMPSSGLEVAYRSLDLLLGGKMDASERDGFSFTQVLDIRRSALPHDGISGQFDYSPERVGELIAQGERQALDAWAAMEAAGHARQRNELAPEPGWQGGGAPAAAY